MVSDVNNLSVTCYADEKARVTKADSANNIQMQFRFCPCCDKKGYYKIPRHYERCRYCGYLRILLPGQDF